MNKRVLVTGGNGFLGRWICTILANKYGAKPISFRSIEYDLTSESETFELFSRYKPDYVIHAAGFNGGIEFNKNYPADIFWKNVSMGLNVHKASVYHKVDKVLNIMASCSYPDTGKEVLYENELWSGPCNTTVACHGYAKRTLQVCAELFYKQYGLYSVCCCITNLFGPNDSFDFERTKVVGAVVRRVVEAHQNQTEKIVNWGTGSPLREFMYVIDAAEAVVQTLIKYEDYTQPLNIGSGHEISIKELVETVVEVVGYTGKVEWDTSKPDGQMKKLLDTLRMRKLLDVPITNFKSAIKSTVEWYIDNDTK